MVTSQHIVSDQNLAWFLAPDDKGQSTRRAMSFTVLDGHGKKASQVVKYLKDMFGYFKSRKL